MSPSSRATATGFGKANRKRRPAGGRSDSRRRTRLRGRGSHALHRSAGYAFATQPAGSSSGPQTAPTSRPFAADRGGLATGIDAPTDPTQRSPAVAAHPFPRLLSTRDRRTPTAAATPGLPRLPPAQIPASRQNPSRTMLKKRRFLMIDNKNAPTFDSDGDFIMHVPPIAL